MTAAKGGERDLGRLSQRALQYSRLSKGAYGQADSVFTFLTQRTNLKFCSRMPSPRRHTSVPRRCGGILRHRCPLHRCLFFFRCHSPASTTGELPACAFVGLETEDNPMDDTGPLTLLMNFIGPILLGLAIFLAAYFGWWRRRNPAAQSRTDAATKNLYDRVEEDRERREGP